MKERDYWLLALLVFFITLNVILYCFRPASDEQVMKTMQKYGCVRTNEYVGKDAELLYLCADGYKYKYRAIQLLANKEIK